MRSSDHGGGAMAAPGEVLRETRLCLGTLGPVTWGRSGWEAEGGSPGAGGELLSQVLRTWSVFPPKSDFILFAAL